MTRQSIYRDIEVRAAATKSFTAAFDLFPSLAQKYLHAFRAAQDESPSPLPGKGFIPLDAWLATFEQVLADIGPNALFQVGQRVINNPNFGDGTHSLEAALRQIDVAYHKSHRKSGVVMFTPTTGRMLEGIGHYEVQARTSEKQISLICDTPYPCPLEHGIISSIAAQFEPRAIVVHNEPARCRMKGSTHCTFVVGW